MKAKSIINAIASGDLKTIQSANKTPVTFIKLKSYYKEPGIYYDAEGKRYTEDLKEALRNQVLQNSEIVFMEIRTY